MSELNIEFGSGETPKMQGYKTCDVRNLANIDYVCKAWEIDKLVAEDSVDNVFSRHFFEHITFAQGELIMKMWLKILKPGGGCRMIIPNLRFHLEKFLIGKNIQRQIAGIYGWQREGLTELWDVHKSGYTVESIERLFKKTGFIDFQQLKSAEKHLDVIAFKPE